VGEDRGEGLLDTFYELAGGERVVGRDQGNRGELLQSALLRRGEREWSGHLP